MAYLRGVSFSPLVQSARVRVMKQSNMAQNVANSPSLSRASVKDTRPEQHDSLKAENWRLIPASSRAMCAKKAAGQRKKMVFLLLGPRDKLGGLVACLICFSHIQFSL